MNHKKACLFFALALFALSPPASTALLTESNYEYFVIGNPADVVKPTTGGLALMGGGKDIDEAFRWLIKKSGGGDIVVIRASGTDAYNPYIYELGKVDSVETIIFKSRAAASDEFVINKIRNAEALFIAGGDQFNYVKYWEGTPVADAIKYLASKNIPIGGTSAGLAILGEFSFSAREDTILSTQALADPFDKRVTLDRDFLSLAGLKGVITDSHFVKRDRMGRLVAFLARIVKDRWARQAKGIGIDEQTALLVEPDGRISLRGSGAAYFLSVQAEPEICLNKTPLTYRHLAVYKIAGSATFNLSRWKGAGGTAYTLSAEAGVLRSSQTEGAIY